MALDTAGVDRQANQYQRASVFHHSPGKGFWEKSTTRRFCRFNSTAPKESQSPITGGVSNMLMTFSEIAKETKVSLSQVRRWARASLFPVLHLGHKVKRVRREEYENFLVRRSKGWQRNLPCTKNIFNHCTKRCWISVIRVNGLRLNENKIDDTEYGIYRHIPKFLYEGRRP